MVFCYIGVKVNTTWCLKYHWKPLETLEHWTRKIKVVDFNFENFLYLTISIKYFSKYSFATKMTHLKVATCYDDPSFGKGVSLSVWPVSLLWKCHILRWLPAKMTYLLAGRVCVIHKHNIITMVQLNFKLYTCVLLNMCACTFTMCKT